MIEKEWTIQWREFFHESSINWKDICGMQWDTEIIEYFIILLNSKKFIIADPAC